MPSRRPFDWAFIPATALPSVSAVSCGWPSFSATTAAQRVRTGARLTLRVSPRFGMTSSLPPGFPEPLDEGLDERADSRRGLASVRVHGINAKLGVPQATRQDGAQAPGGELVGDLALEENGEAEACHGGLAQHRPRRDRQRSIH